MLIELKLAEQTWEKERIFSKEIYDRYKEDKEGAKAYYYKMKMGMDVSTEEGANDRK